MSARNRACAWENLPFLPEKTPKPDRAPIFSDKPLLQSGPALRVMPLLKAPQPRRFLSVPTHAVGVHTEQRESPRALLRLPLQLRSVSGAREEYPITLFTRDISSS